MPLNEISDNCFTLTSSLPVREICQPLYEKLGIGYFTFHRIFADATTIRLSSYPEWSRHYIQKDYFMIFQEDHYPCTLNHYEYFLWDDYLKSDKIDARTIPIIKESIHDFSINHGFTLLRRHENYCDTFNFGYLREVSNFNSTRYLANIEFIEKFTHYFTACSKSLIAQAYHSRFKTLFSKKYYNPDDHLPQSFACFSQPQKLMPDDLGTQKFTALTLREQQCLALSARGFTAKETAKALGLSYRTVQYYIDNVHRKTGVKKTNKIIHSLYSGIHLK